MTGVKMYVDASSAQCKLVSDTPGSVPHPEPHTPYVPLRAAFPRCSTASLPSFFAHSFCRYEKWLAAAKRFEPRSAIYNSKSCAKLGAFSAFCKNGNQKLEVRRRLFTKNPSRHPCDINEKIGPRPGLCWRNLEKNDRLPSPGCKMPGVKKVLFVSIKEKGGDRAIPVLFGLSRGKTDRV